MIHREHVPHGSSVTAVAEETARVLSAVDLLVSDILYPQRLASEGSRGIPDNAPQCHPPQPDELRAVAQQGAISDSVVRGTGWTGAVEHTTGAREGSERGPAARRPPTSVAIGLMCAPDMRSCGDQYGDGWTLMRTVGVGTDAVWREYQETVPSPSPTATDPPTMQRAIASQTHAPSVRHTATDPIRCVTVGTTTDVHGGDIVEVAHVSRFLRSALDALCSGLERMVQESTHKCMRRVARLAASPLAVLGSAVGQWRSDCAVLRIQNERAEQEVAALQNELNGVRLQADEQGREIATWRQMCEEMAQNAESTALENEKLRHHVALLETMVGRFETAMVVAHTSTASGGAAVVETNSTQDQHAKQQDDQEREDEDGRSNCSASHSTALRGSGLDRRSGERVGAEAVSVLPSSMAGRRPPRGPTHVSPGRRASVSPLPPPNTTSHQSASSSASLQTVLDLYRQCEVALSLDDADEEDS